MSSSRYGQAFLPAPSFLAQEEIQKAFEGYFAFCEAPDTALFRTGSFSFLFCSVSC